MLRAAACCVLAAVAVSGCASARAAAPESRCFGTPASGRLEHGVHLPLSGNNFVAYTRLARALDRNAVHSRVATVVVEAFARLADSHAELRFVYGETGHVAGGPFPPHRTHQNGLSVDFMVPVRDARGRVTTLPTWPWNRYGYDLEFDAEGRLGGLQVDFEAIALHLRALHEAGQRHGVGIGRVIIDPPWIAKLHATGEGAYLRRHLRFLDRPAWVRHDDHYHVDFHLPCAPVGGP